ncbi:ABC transporter permease [Paralimibaculum aggregatum]|uniref:ABC transporter permease n=1 Tax=Paralimibaculum aggregatum TaxID=3036245 RepID=A0ABQ6LDF0_9RHOB|nr:ABC transporter permease [Limibaculum sp. NKW23]GMG81376.1 ABC transporter permease [Limibaculum sp. NKW23]
MLIFILKRLGVIALSMVCLTLVVFYMVNLDPNLEKIAKTQGSMRMTDAEVESWLERNGYREPFLEQYGSWLVNFVQGDMGDSLRFQKPVEEVMPERLGYTGILMFWVMLVMVPGALIIGVLAGMREGSTLDRSLSVASITSTSAPEYVTGILFTVIFASTLGWFKGIASTREITFENFTLPVLTMSIYGMGYIARMTRASMAEVMTSQYIRTARLKGMAFRQVVLKHALRNALIAPFTVIMLQFPWLLTGVVIVEAMFNYKGFGWLLVRAAENNDIDLLLACSCVAVVVVLLTQLISDIGYAYLNPRIRVR